MDSKKKLARLEMLKRFSKSKSSEMHEPSVGKKLSEKKAAKAPVVAEEPKTLSKAQMILKAKLGELMSEVGEEEEDEDELEEEAECPECEDEGCEACEEDEDEE